MPIYHYKAKENDSGCDYCRGGFDAMQSMTEKPLTHCPRCHGPIHKVPARCGGGTPMMSSGNLKDKGFTKLVKRDKGVYERD